ncbi:39843_t:CDS:2 [Gigaspora margarita]|uniref:Autophagy-related protein n=1 Tax=Gigaspora margarita TaxID=4874 RepID=A0ABN7UIT7_GIGMA|nr:39843_t:CDS:2 [Gigaspora margarita]
MNLENSEEEKSASIANEELTPITKKEFAGWYILCAANGIYGGAPIGGDTESYSLYIISISVIVQTVLFISCGSLADHGKLQKMFALFYAFIGATATILFAAVTSPLIEARNSNVPIIEIKKLEDEMTVNLSSHSLVVAIFAAMLVMFSAGAILILTTGSSYGIQIALAFAGSCWLGSSWIGTIASGIIINYTHNIRSPFWFLLVVIAFPAIIFCTVNVEKGKADAEKYSKRENVDNS